MKTKIQEILSLIVVVATALGLVIGLIQITLWINHPFSYMLGFAGCVYVLGHAFEFVNKTVE